MNFRTAKGWSSLAAILIFGNCFIGNAQTDSIYRLPAGTRLRVKMEAEINSRVSSVNDTFTVATVSPVKVGETVVLPAGAIVEGRVIAVKPASFGGRTGRLEFAFEKLRISDDVSRAIDGGVLAPARSGSGSLGLLSIFGGLGVGTAIGAASGSRTGTIAGAAVGAAGGTIFAAARKGKEVRYTKGQEFEIVLRKEVVLPVLDY